MLIGLLALVAAGAFAGVAFYVGVVEQPARLKLGDAAMLAEWQASYPRAAGMQAPLAVVGGTLGLWAYYDNLNWCWLIGVAALLGAVLYTLTVMMGTNKALLALRDGAAEGEARALVQSWGRLHAVRTWLGLLAVIFFLVALS